MMELRLHFPNFSGGRGRRSYGFHEEQPKRVRYGNDQAAFRIWARRELSGMSKAAKQCVRAAGVKLSAEKKATARCANTNSRKTERGWNETPG